MKKFLDFSGTTYLYSKIVEYINTKIAERVPFKLGIDSNGNYGYYKEGADTVTPFKRLVKAGDITISYIANTFDLSQYKNITINDIFLVVNSFDIIDTSGAKILPLEKFTSRTVQSQSHCLMAH